MLCVEAFGGYRMGMLTAIKCGEKYDPRDIVILDLFLQDEYISR